VFFISVKGKEEKGSQYLPLVEGEEKECLCRSHFPVPAPKEKRGEGGTELSTLLTTRERKAPFTILKLLVSLRRKKLSSKGGFLKWQFSGNGGLGEKEKKDTLPKGKGGEHEVH